MKIEIIQSTLNLYRAHGVKSLSLDDISRLLGISRKTLTHFFGSKEVLLNECIKYRISQEEIFKYTDDSLLDVLLNYAEALPKLYQGINQRCCLEIRKYYPETCVFFSNYLHVYAMSCRDKVAEGVANGYIRKRTNPELVYCLLREYFSRLFPVSSSSARYSVDISLTTDMIIAFARGISTMKGCTYIENKLKKRVYHETN